jgi:ACS family allantoate permease-like MFS transporter
MFLVTGIVTVLWSIIVFFFLPSSQGTAKFLTEEEQVAAVEMVRGNNTGIHNKKFKLKQLKEALLDPKSYFFFWFAFFGNLANSIATVSTSLAHRVSLLTSAL